MAARVKVVPGGCGVMVGGEVHDAVGILTPCRMNDVGAGVLYRSTEKLVQESLRTGGAREQAGACVAFPISSSPRWHLLPSENKTAQPTTVR